MSRSASVSLIWGDGRHQFRLAIAELDELDELCKVGPGYLLAQLNGGLYGPWRAKAVRETIRLGLVGGGMAPAAAVQLVESYFDRTPIGDHLVTAQAILMACVLGDENDPPGEPKGKAKRPSRKAASGSDPSGSAQAPSASPTSDASASGSSTGSTPAGSALTSRTRRARRASPTSSVTS